MGNGGIKEVVRRGGCDFKVVEDGYLLESWFGRVVEGECCFPVVYQR